MASTSLSTGLDCLFRDITSNFSPKERKDVVQTTKGTFHGKFERLEDEDLYSCLRLFEEQGHVSDNKLTLIEGFVAQKSDNERQIKEQIRLFKASHPPKSVGEKELQGRNDDVRKIMEKLDKGETPVVNLHGSAGVGKTTLANEICSRWQGDHFTVDLRGANGMSEVYLSVMRALDPNEKVRISDLDINFIVKAVRDKLQEVSKKGRSMLLFLDNVDQFTGGKSKEAKNLNIAFLQFLEKFSQLVSVDKKEEFKILLTSRSKFHHPKVVDDFEVETLASSVSKQLLQSYGKVSLDTSENEKLVEFCKRKPLLLRGLAAILRQEVQSPKQLIDKIEQEIAGRRSETASTQTEKTELPKEPLDLEEDGVDEGQMSLLREMFNSLPSDHFRSSAMSVSLFCGPFSATVASLVLGINAPEATVLLEGLRTREIIFVADADAKELMYDIHPLLKKYANSIKSNLKYKKSFKEAEGRFCNLFMGRMRALAQLLDSDYIKAYNQFESDRPNYEFACDISLISEYYLIPSNFHETASIASLFDAMLSGERRRKVFHLWAEKAQGDGSSGSQWHADLKSWEALQVLNVYGPHKAFLVLEEAAASLTNVSDKESESYRLSQGLFFYAEGEIQYSNRDYKKALDSLESSLRLLEGLEAHTTLARCLNSIGNCHFSLDRLDKALDFFHKAYDMRKRLSGSELHFDMPVYKNQIGAVLERKGQYEKAIESYEDALRLLKDLRLTGNLDEAQFYRNIANAYAHQNKHEEALEPAKKAFEIREKVLGKHPLTARSLFLIGVLWANLQKYTDALECFQTSWKMEKELGPGNHSEVWNRIIAGVENMFANLRKRSELKKFQEEVLEFLQQMWEEEKQFQGFSFTEYNQELIDAIVERIGSGEESRDVKYKYEKEALWFYQNRWKTAWNEKDFLFEFDQEADDVRRANMIRQKDEVLNKVIELSQNLGQQEKSREYKLKKLALYKDILLLKKTFFGRKEYEKGKLKIEVEKLYHELGAEEKIPEFRQELLCVLEELWEELKHFDAEEKEKEVNQPRKETIEGILGLCGELEKRDLTRKYGVEALHFYEKLWEKRQSQMRSSDKKKLVRRVEDLAMSVGDLDRKRKYQVVYRTSERTGHWPKSLARGLEEIPVSQMQEMSLAVRQERGEEEEVEVELEGETEVEIEVGAEGSEDDKTLIQKDVVDIAGTIWDLKHGAVHVTFPPNAVTGPSLITVHRWKPANCSPSLHEGEYLVSNVIELSADGGLDGDLNFGKEVKLALSHSSTDLEGYEVVMKKLVNRENNDWIDLETTDIKQLSEIAGDYQSEDDIPDFLLPVAEAEIFQCSCYAVVCRLKRYEFTITSKAAVFTIPDYPDVTVAVPKNAVPTREKIPIVLKVQEVAPEDFKDKEIFLGPVLTIECSPIEFLRPVIIQMPVSLGDQVNEGRDFPDKTRVRVLFRGSDAETEWTEITSDLEKPPRFDGSAVKFQVKHFSGFLVLFEWCPVPLKPLVFALLPRFPVLFSVYVEDAVQVGSEVKWNIFCSSPHMRRQLLNDPVKSHLTEESALRTMVQDEKAYVFLSGEGVEAVHQEELRDLFVLFQGPHAQFKRGLDVRVTGEGRTRLRLCSSSQDNGGELLCRMTIRMPIVDAGPEHDAPVEFFGVPLDDDDLLSAPMPEVSAASLPVLNQERRRDIYELYRERQDRAGVQEYFGALARLREQAQEDCFQAIVNALDTPGLDHIAARLISAREIVSRPCSDDVVNIVSESTSNSWRRVARGLGITPAQIDAIYEEEADDLERCRRALEIWRQRNGESATVRALMVALTNARRANVNMDIMIALNLYRHAH